MPKLLLFSDLHAHTHKNSIRRLQHCLDALTWVFETAIERNIKDVLFLGDLFQDREKIQVLSYQRTYEIINKYAGGDNPKVKLYLLVGNHDMFYADKCDVSSVLPFGSISNVRIIKEPEVINIGDIDIAFLPFTLNPPKSLELLRNAPVLCGHLALDGAYLNTFHKTESDVSVEYDGDMIKVNSSLFKNWQRVFLGHYHGEQKIDHVEYVGSPLQLNFAEAFQTKHIIELDTKDLSTIYIENTFSPKHLIINEKQLDQDLSNTFVKLQPSDISASDIVDLKEHLLKERKVLSLEFMAPQDDSVDITLKENLEEAQADFKNNQAEILARYMDTVGIGSLNREKLLAVGELIRQKVQVE